MNKLSAKQLVKLNQKIIGETDCPNKKIPDLVKSIADIPYSKDENFIFVYRTLAEKAAKLGCLIAVEKPFEHGNDQTAMLSMLTMLELNGNKMMANMESLYDLSGHLKNDDLVATCRWIRAHSVSREKPITEKIL